MKTSKRTRRSRTADKRSSGLRAARGSATSHASTESIFKGETWLAYRPGEDVTFKDAWVSRTERGVMCSVVNSKQDLIANAKLCKVRLKWQNDKLRDGGPTTPESK